jgi:hypothetical protein
MQTPFIGLPSLRRPFLLGGGDYVMDQEGWLFRFWKRLILQIYCKIEELKWKKIINNTSNKEETFIALDFLNRIYWAAHEKTLKDTI